MENKLENMLNGICPSCEEESILEYLGPQEKLKGHPEQLYNCRSCKSTISLGSYERINLNSKASSQ